MLIFCFQEHVACPGCYATGGYCGYRLSVEEMSGCRSLQALLKKDEDEDWQVEADDQDFERTSNYFLTGISDGSPDESPAMDLKPLRHGVEEVWVFSISEDFFVSFLGILELRTWAPIESSTGTSYWTSFSPDLL